MTDNGLRAIAATLLFAAALLGPGPVAAQGYYINPSLYTNLYAVNGAQLAQNLQFAARMKQLRSVQATLAAADKAVQRNANAAPKPAAQAVTAPSAPLSATDFEPTGRRDAPQRLAAQLKDPAARQQVGKMARDILVAIEQQPTFRKNNLAYALTVFLGGSLQVLSGREFSDEQSQALAQWFNDEMVAAGVVARLGPAERTQLYDALLLQGGLILGIAQAGIESGDAEQVRIAKTMARDALSTFGIPL